MRSEGALTQPPGGRGFDSRRPDHGFFLFSGGFFLYIFVFICFWSMLWVFLSWFGFWFVLFVSNKAGMVNVVLFDFLSRFVFLVFDVILGVV